MSDTLLRFVTNSRHPPYGNRTGVFAAAYDLRRRRGLSVHQHDDLDGLLGWFREHLVVPDKLSTSRYPRAKPTAISWIHFSAYEHLARLRELAALVQAAGFVVDELRTCRPGYVVYEDDHQVVALPFSDTPS